MPCCATKQANTYASWNIAERMTPVHATIDLGYMAVPCKIRADIVEDKRWARNGPPCRPLYSLSSASEESFSFLHWEHPWSFMAGWHGKNALGRNRQEIAWCLKWHPTILGYIKYLRTSGPSHTKRHIYRGHVFRLWIWVCIFVWTIIYWDLFHAFLLVFGGKWCTWTWLHFQMSEKQTGNCGSSLMNHIIWVSCLKV